MAALGLLGVLAAFDPAQHTFYPRCSFKMLTGWDCPGCGGLRAAHQLLHGHVRAAFALNPFWCVVLPIAGWVVMAQWAERTWGRRWAHPFRHRAWVWALAGATVAFGILRNLPVGWLTAAGP